MRRKSAIEKFYAGEQIDTWCTPDDDGRNDYCTNDAEVWFITFVLWGLAIGVLLWCIFL